MNRKTEYEFLPAALELVASPPSPIGRAIIWVIVMFFLVVVIWAYHGNIDIVAVAMGKIIPSENVKIIQPIQMGVVKQIYVTEGKHVLKGDDLIDLDSTDSSADKETIETELRQATIDQLRLTQLINTNKSEQQTLIKDNNELAKYPMHRALLLKQQQEYTTQVASFKDQIIQQKAERRGIRYQVASLNATLPLITERANALKNLLENDMGSRDLWLEMEQERIERTNEVEIQKAKVKSVDAMISSLINQKKMTKAKYLSQWITELNEARKKISNLKQELIKIAQRQSLQRLKSPVTGVVQQLITHTIGGVVTPAQELMIIVPDEHPLEVEATLLNKDIGFVYENQEVSIKVEAFPFTKYGFIQGNIRHISHDAILDEQKGLVYSSRVKMEKTTIAVGDKNINLTPGMAVTVEVKTGKRRLIEYFLSPLLKYKSESVRER